MFAFHFEKYSKEEIVEDFQFQQFSYNMAKIVIWVIIIYIVGKTIFKNERIWHKENVLIGITSHITVVWDIWKLSY